MTFQEISRSISEILSNIFASAAVVAPRIFWAIAVAGIGWLTSLLLKKITLHAMHGLDQLLERKAAEKGSRHVRIKQSLEKFIGEAVFWISLFCFLVISIQILQIELLSSFLADILKRLPMMTLGILIIIASFSIGSITRQIVTSAFEAMEIEQAELFGNGAKLFIVVIGILLGVAQIGIDISFLTSVVSISFAAVLGAIALAFALGAQSYVANILSAVQARRVYQDGDIILVDGVKGKIIEISSTVISLQTEEGQVAIPAKVFMEKQSLLMEQEDKDAA